MTATLSARARLSLTTTDTPAVETAVTPPATNQTWRVIVDGEHTAAWNMAVDQAMLDAVADGIAGPTVRVYRWSESAVTVGRYQDVGRTIRVEACRDLGIPIVRRPTGGRGILHGGDVTVSVAAPTALLGDAARSVRATYRVLGAGLVATLRALGIEPENPSAETGRGRGGDCFASVGAPDLTVRGVKLVGTALRRTQGAVLQQSSLRHRPGAVAAAEVFVGAVAPAEYPLRSVPAARIEQALVAGFGSALGGRLAPGLLTGWEEERAAALSSPREP